MSRPTRRRAAGPIAPISSIPAHISSPKSSQAASTTMTTSDDSEGLVTKKTISRSQLNSGIARMSGALPVGEERAADGKRVKPVRGRERETLTRIAREEAAVGRAVQGLRRRGERATVNAGKVGVVSADKVTTYQTTKRAEQPARPPSTLQVQRSQPEADSDEDMQRVAPRTRRVSVAPMSIRKPMSTPRAEASMIAIANFKRRSRAPSLLRIGNADETASISSDGSLGDLMPDDESTPLPQPRAPRAQQLQLSLGDDSSPSLVPFPLGSNSSRKRKRELPEILVPNSQSSYYKSPLESSRTRPIDVPSDHSLPSSELSLPHLLPYSAPGSPQHLSSTMAPPESSSPRKPLYQKAQEVEALHLQKGKQKKRNDDDRGIAQGWSRRKNASRVLDTAALQHMLPRRRQTAARDGEFDIYSSDGPGPESDVDELSFAPSKRRAGAGRKKIRQALSERKTPAKNAKKSTGKKVAAMAVTPLVKGGRTYSRRASGKENLVITSDSPNEDEVEPSSTVSPDVGRVSAHSQPSKELESIAQKFADVDRWEMDFEVVTGSSSPHGAR